MKLVNFLENMFLKGKKGAPLVLNYTSMGILI